MKVLKKITTLGLETNYEMRTTKLNSANLTNKTLTRFQPVE